MRDKLLKEHIKNLGEYLWLAQGEATNIKRILQYYDGYVIGEDDSLYNIIQHLAQAEISCGNL